MIRGPEDIEAMVAGLDKEMRRRVIEGAIQDLEEQIAQAQLDLAALQAYAYGFARAHGLIDE